ncbi:CAP domain-containing protein [Deinococcus yavapaiensis]|uniref:CAP domain-containing protein n=1 Tax=Deinococcus yavapaiensis TaxID=309889 RepID=UPI001472DD8A|nr:CAP domain-containing protein [Deinococcus yavapaiensis]
MSTEAPAEPPNPAVRKSDSVETQLLANLDDLRASGVTCPGEASARTSGPVTADPRLARAAQQQAEFIAASGQVAHEGPDGTRPRDRAAAQGVTSSAVTEIVYLGQRGSFDRAVTWWLDSPIHCEIIADARYHSAGVSVQHGEHGTAYVVVFSDRSE